MATDFGSDLDVRDDLPVTDRVVSGLPNLGNALYRRLITPNGTLIGDPDYGLDVRQLLSMGMTAQLLAPWMDQISTECEKDDRVLSASTSYTVLGPDSVQLDVVIQTADGPFTLVALAGQLSLQLISFG